MAKKDLFLSPDRWLPVTALAGYVALSATATPIMAQEGGWNPFAAQNRTTERPRRRRRSTNASPRRPYLAPMTRMPNDEPYRPNPAPPPGYTPGARANTYIPPTVSRGTLAAPPVERGNLTPSVSAVARLPAGVWQGLDAPTAERLLAPLSVPPASPALNDLLKRVMEEPTDDPQLDAVRLAVLVKAGHFANAIRLRDRAPPPNPTAPVRDVIEARLELATGATDAGCARIKRAVAALKQLPKQLRGEAIVLAGYCTIIAGNARAGSLAGELARDTGYNRRFTLALLEAIANGGKVQEPLPKRVTTLDGLLVKQLKSPDPALIEAMLAKASAGFVWLIATDRNAASSLRLRAAEQAAAANIISPAGLSEAYRAAAEAADGRTAKAAHKPADGAANRSLERARQFAIAERQQAQFTKTRAIRSLLDSARRDGLYHAVAVAVAPLVRTMRPTEEISWFSETAVETLAAAGDYQTAREWVHAAPPSRRRTDALHHWLMLLDIADTQVASRDRNRSMQLLEDLALSGRFSSVALHRLATVLDALDYNVPIPLWNLASRTEQPQTGHLPQTGLLSAMKKASEARQIAATTLYAVRSIAPQGTSATHLLGLGETIRALKRAGLEGDARRLAFEALFSDWPRTG